LLLFSDQYRDLVLELKNSSKEIEDCENASQDTLANMKKTVDAKSDKKSQRKEQREVTYAFFIFKK